MRNFLSILALGFFLAGFAVPAWAPPPPLPDEELRETSDLIVTGKVVSVAPHGKIHADACYRWQDYEAELAVEKREQGECGKTVNIRYSRRVGNVDRCVGGKESYHLETGKGYRLFLQRAKGALETYTLLQVDAPS